VALWIAGTRLLAEVFMVLGSYWPRPNAWFYRQVSIRALEVWGRWDTEFYLGIAQNGYPPLELDPGGWIYNAAYFPLYPCLMRGLSVLLGGAELFYVGLFIANAMLVLGVVYVRKLARLDEGDGFADLVMACLLAYPGSHFFSCVYPESTALFLSAFALYCARRGMAPAAGLACGLAAITRSSGALVALPVLWLLCRGEDGRLRPRWRALWLACPVVTLGALMLLNYQLYQDPIYFVHVQAGWGRRPSFPLEPFLSLKLSPDYHFFALGAAALVVWAIVRKQRAEYVLLSGPAVLLPLSTGMLRGIHRYMGSNFPLFFFLAKLLRERRGWRYAYLGAGLVTLAVFSFKWGQGAHPN
jgi:hypothetical protein